MKIMPQEVEVWYLLPAIRKELTMILSKKHHLKQKEISTILGISEAAVSQYQNAKRGQEMSFTQNEKKEIEKSAQKIAEDKIQANNIILNLCTTLKGSQSFCKLHMKKDSSIPKNCDICFKKH